MGTRPQRGSPSFLGAMEWFQPRRQRAQMRGQEPRCCWLLHRVSWPPVPGRALHTCTPVTTCPGVRVGWGPVAVAVCGSGLSAPHPAICLAQLPLQLPAPADCLLIPSLDICEFLKVVRSVSSSFACCSQWLTWTDPGSGRLQRVMGRGRSSPTPGVGAWQEARRMRKFDWVPQCVPGSKVTRTRVPRHPRVWGRRRCLANPMGSIPSLLLPGVGEAPPRTQKFYS